MAFDTSITPGAPPLLWSNVNQAFKQINENFDILVATIGGGSGLTPLNFETLDTSLSPTDTNTYTVGTITKQWKRVHTAEWQNAGDETLNGVWLGSAQIKGKGLIVDLPVGSTVDGNLIIDPDKTFIKTIQVDSDKSLESDVYGFTANFTSGLGIALQVTSASDEIEFNVDPTFDLTGSIYADDTTLLVDRLGYIRGNVNVLTNWSITADTKVWGFDQTGTLTFPSGSTFKETGSEDILLGAVSNDLVVSSDQDIKIVTAANSGIVTWTFKDTGEFVVPSSVDFEYSGNATFNLSTTTTSGRLVGEVDKTFSVVLTDGTDTHEWAYATDGSLTFPGGQTIDITGYSGNVNGLDITADTFIVGTYSGTPASNYFQVEDTSTNRVRVGGPGQQQIELSSYFSTHANGDEGPEILWRQTTDVYANFVVGSLYSRITDVTNGNEVGELVVQINSSGSYNDVATFTADGIVGNVIGTLSGNVTGNVLGDLTGNVLGDLTGNVTGNVTGGVVSATTLRTSEQKIALGSDAGLTSQSTYAVAIGQEAGEISQGSSAVSIGYLSGNDSQGNQAVSIGYQAGSSTQGSSGVAIGFEAGKISQGTYGISIGHLAGETSQGTQSIAIGAIAGGTSQGANSIAMGYQAGGTSQGSIAVAIGQNAGETNQGSSGVAIGYYAGKDNQDTGAVAIGYVAAQVTQGQAGVAIGWGAGQTNQGDYAIAIGYRAGFTNQNPSSIVLNASGVSLDAAAAGFFVNPIRSSSSSAKALMFDTATSELFYNSTLEFIGSTISTSDSSGLTIDVLTTFNSDIVVENDVRIRGSKVLNLADIKSIVADSTDFANFQARIAAL